MMKPRHAFLEIAFDYGAQPLTETAFSVWISNYVVHGDRCFSPRPDVPSDWSAPSMRIRAAERALSDEIRRTKEQGIVLPDDFLASLGVEGEIASLEKS